MNINLTLIGQMLTFLVLVLFTMKFVWPNVINALNEREKKIADGLAAAERGERELELAQHKATEQLRDAKVEAARIVKQADERAAHMVEDAKEQARNEGKRMIELAEEEIVREKHAAKEALCSEIASLALLGAERILGKKIDGTAHNEMVEQLIAEVGSE